MPRKTRRGTKRQKRTRKGAKKGGRLIGQGAYGCVYMPAIRCEGQETVSPKTVSKLIRPDEAKKERMQYVLLLRSLLPKERQAEFMDVFQTSGISAFQEKLMEIPDPDIQRKIQYVKDTFLFPTAVCSPAKQAPEEAKENPISACKITRATSLLQLPYGGIDMDDLLTSPIVQEGHIRSILSDVGQLFDALEFLHTHGVAHMDIKPENIVIDVGDDGVGRVRFIDYGFMVFFDRFHTSKSIYRTDYYAWPFEVRFLDFGYNKSDITSAQIATFRFGHVQTKSRPVPPSVYIDKFNDFVLNKKNLDELYDRFQTMPPEERIAMIAKGCDVFALGRALFFLVHKIPSYATNPVYAPLLALLNDMMKWNPFERISITEAKRRYAEWAETRPFRSI